MLEPQWMLPQWRLPQWMLPQCKARGKYRQNNDKQSAALTHEFRHGNKQNRAVC